MKQILFPFFLSLAVGISAQKVVTLPLCTLEGHKDVVRSLSINSAGDVLISGSYDRNIKFWDIATGTLTATTSVPDPVRHVALSPNGNFFAHSPSILNKDAKAQKQATVWKTADKNEAFILGAEAATIQCVAFSSNGKYLATGDRLGDVRIIDAQSLQEVRRYNEKNNTITTLSFFGENDRFLAAGGDKAVRVWDYMALKVQEVAAFNTGGNYVNGLSISPDAKFIAAVGNEEKVDIFDLITGKKQKTSDGNVATFVGPTHALNAVAYSPDGKLLAAAGLGGIVYVWDAHTRFLLAQFQAPPVAGASNFIWSLVFSPDNRYLFSGGSDKTIKMWDVTEFTGAKRAMPITKWTHPTNNPTTDSIRKTVQFWVHSFYPINELVVFKNNKPLPAKFQETGFNKRIYNLTFELDVKENKIRIEASNEAGKTVSDEKNIMFIPATPQASWIAPTNDMTTQEGTNRVQFCINSSVALQEVKIYHNGGSIADADIVRVPGNGNCYTLASAMINLVPGKNTLYLTANNGGILGQSSERLINYVPPKPRIEWVSSLKDSTQNAEIEVILCVTSVMPIKGYEMENLTLVNLPSNRALGVGKDTKKNKESLIIKSNCPNQYTATIPLIPNRNMLRLKVYTEFDTVLSDTRTIIRKDTSKAGEGNYYALLIGESQYQDGNIPDLQNPGKDADSLASVLTRKYTFDAKNVIVLHDASKQQILNSLDELSAKITPKDKLIFFYAGHGIEKNKIGYFIPVDAAKDRTSGWLSSEELRALLGQVKAQHTLLIADACFGGSFVMRSMTEEMQTTKICEVLDSKPSRRGITSGAAEEVPDQSIFMYYLLQALRTETAHCFSSNQLLAPLLQAVITNSPNGQTPQGGPLQGIGHEGGDFIFHKK